MQLKMFLLIGFVLNVFCLNNLSGEFLTPKYDLRKNESLLESLKKDPSSFVELFAKADPEKINDVIGLLEALAAKASSDLDLLDSHVNDASISLDTAVSNVVQANINVETASTNKQTAQSALEQADIYHTSALHDQTNAVNEEQRAQSAKDVADQNYAEQSPSLLDEQRVIQNVIQILRDLNDYHLAPPGSHICDYGHNVPQSACEESARLFYPSAGPMQVGSGGTCLDGGWGQVPLGCSVQSGGGKAAHYKTSGDNQIGCIHEDYQLVCQSGCNEDTLFEGSYCGKSTSENCGGAICTESSRQYSVASLEDCKALCRPKSDCEFVSFTASNNGDCLMYDRCPEPRQYGNGNAGTVTTSVCEGR